VHDRIKLLYGSEYGVEISSELGEGTKVKIRLPVI
jgi:two-component system, sensor histidine kinase YesM